MLDYRNILRVASDPHKSMRTMELELRSSHHTIRKVLDAAGKAGIGWLRTPFREITSTGEIEQPFRLN